MVSWRGLDSRGSSVNPLSVLADYRSWISRSVRTRAGGWMGLWHPLASFARKGNSKKEEEDRGPL